jgi:DNA-binding SARP family transcriptional activator
MDVGDHPRALAHARAATTTDPFDEPAWRTVMRAHVIAGEPAAALTAYEQLRTTLADELGTDPAPETQSLHLAILRGDQAAPDPRGSQVAPDPDLRGSAGPPDPDPRVGGRAAPPPPGARGPQTGG